jgi:GNAT superfamily N-acetyltransferase
MRTTAKIDPHCGNDIGDEPMFIIPWQEAMAANATSRPQIRTATERDLDRLVEYFRTLSRSSRYNRFMEPDCNFANFAFQRVVQSRGADSFILIAEMQQQGRGAIIGEASYMVGSETGRGEFALSVGHAWHGRGVGSALLSALEARAISLGDCGLFGETFNTNEPMKALAQKAGFAFARSDDWRAIRFEKQLLRQPCARQLETALLV